MERWVLAESLKHARGTLEAITCDVAKEDEIIAMFSEIKNKYGGVDVCVNNAGLSHNAPLLSGETEQWRNMFEVNVIGLLVCSREAFKSMQEREVDDGHIFLMNSMSGHRLVPNSPGIHCYAATKFAVRAITEGLRNELLAAKTHIRVTSISPGLAKTEFMYRHLQDSSLADQVYSRFETMTAEDITDSLIYALSAPPRVQVHDILIRPTEGTT
ncbi:dehydrogenase/reductase SDR family member 11-like isoform X2 [Dreissena polymorpha]|uniref:dehydrogenase/reductase SDR family member 11-like isoform X2 n=1 Tax=Dreissena polymorpha TaxID=45954 RepID=UPI0022642618|nr:dehydrogenase/reductase SDR family member 11-like isoform X2 [Dreissena polymorpha]